MATTTNYGWTTPDDTALVKDGAAAIRTLGTSVDTTTKNLNPSTTLGDIEYRSSTANTNTRLGIGSTNQVLTVSGGVPTWATLASGGAMTLLSTTTLSSSTTDISITPTGYKDLQIYMKDFQFSADAGFWFTLNNDTTTYNYIGALAYYRSVNGNAGVSASADNQVSLSYYDWLSGNYNNTGCITIFDITNTSTGKSGMYSLNGSSTGSANAKQSYNASFAWLNTSAISSIQFKSSGGNMSAGSIEIYGVK
jgi:hypothetical protein